MGSVLRYFKDVGYHDEGRVILIVPDDNALWYLPFPPPRRSPEKAGDNRAKPDGANFSAKPVLDHALRMPRRISLICLPQDYSFVEFVQPVHWYVSEEELATGISKSNIVGSRTNLKGWLEYRELHKLWIEPIFKDQGAYELLECGLFNEIVAQQAKAIGISRRKLTQAVLRHFLGNDHRNAHLPAFGIRGGKGAEKNFKTKPGRQRDAVRRGKSTNNGYKCTAQDRRWLARGWRTYKKAGVSERRAYLLTCLDHWPGNEAVKETGERFLLAPQLMRPSFRQFRSAALKEKADATRVNMGERVFKECRRALRGTAKDNVVLAGQLVLIDSTSEDQTPVSRFNINDVLPSTWRTVVFDVKTEYIFGVYSGFESPSTLTSLLALNNAGTPKIEFCARHNVSIVEGEWHHRVAKRVRADNGELKSMNGIRTLNTAEVTIEFVRSYSGSSKGLLEAHHRSAHAHADHQNVGSTLGKKRGRGEPDKNKSASRTHFTNMEFVIRSILRHNNEVPVPHLLTVEMRQENVQPTRRAIYEWHVNRGYAASEPQNLDDLRSQCLPRLEAVLHRDGVYLFDPRFGHHERLIKGLVYSSEWLIESGYCEDSFGKSDYIEAMIDPNDLSRIFFFRDAQLRCLERRTNDSLANELTLCEHLLMTDSDKDLVEPLKENLDEQDVHRIVDNRKANRDATKARKAAQENEAAAGNTKSPALSKTEGKARELEAARYENLGLNPEFARTKKKPSSRIAASADSAVSAEQFGGAYEPKPFTLSSQAAVEAAEAAEALMDELRAAGRK